MLADVALHWALDMTGAGTMWCLYRGCNNPAHQHRPFVAMLGRNPWIFQSVFALIIAYVTVRLVG